MLIVLLTACTNPPDADPAARATGPDSLGHVHGLGTDPAADPSDPTRVLATTADGVVTYRADGGSQTPVVGAPPLMLLDWPTADLLIGVSAEGDVYRSSDGGGSRQRTDGPPGTVQAVHINGPSWFIATDAGLFRSTDDGRRWDALTAQ